MPDTPIEQLREARAKAIAQVLFDASYGGTDDPTLTDMLAAICTQQGEGAALAIEAADAAMGVVTVPKNELENLVSLLRQAMLFRAYVEYSPGPLSEPWATKVLRDGEAMLAASPYQEKNDAT